MDEERQWQRIVDAAHVLAKANKVEVPETLITVSGNVWQQDALRRDALREFLPKLKNFDATVADMPLENIADLLDDSALSLLDIKPASSGRGHKRSQPEEEATPE